MKHYYTQKTKRIFRPRDFKKFAHGEDHIMCDERGFCYVYNGFYSLMNGRVSSIEKRVENGCLVEICNFWDYLRWRVRLFFLKSGG